MITHCAENSPVKTFMLKIVSPNYPFQSRTHALSFFNSSNPARQKSINFFEVEKKSPPSHEWDQHDLWAACSKAIRRAKKLYSEQAQWCWMYANIGARDSNGNLNHLHPQEISIQFGIPIRTVYKHCREINAQLERELCVMGLIPKLEQEHRK